MPVQVYQPNRSTMRLVFQLALSACTLPGAVKEIQDASNYHEYLWDAADKKDAAKEKPETTDESAVAKYGINSPEAQAVRDVRREARLKSQAEAAKPKATNIKKKEQSSPQNT